MRILKRGARFALHVVSRLLVGLLRCLPVQNRVFFYTIRSNGELLDNLKSVYDACDCKKTVFAKMLPHSRLDMLRACYGLLTSRVIVTDDYVKYFRTVKLHPAQKVVQLWHACGAFKKFGLDAPSRLTEDEERATHAPYTDVCVSAEGVRAFYAGAFGIGIDRVKALGVPRTDRLFDASYQTAQRELLLQAYPDLRGKKIYLYLPTFREENGTVRAFDPQLDFEALNRELQADERFVICRHPVMKQTFVLRKEADARVLDLTDVPTLRLLCAANAVITDYSSVVFDASLLGLPTVFYCPDLADYERSFYLDFETELPGAIVTKSEDLLAAVRNAEEQPDRARLQAFCKSQMAACDGHSTERIVSRILEYLR